MPRPECSWRECNGIRSRFSLFLNRKEAPTFERLPFCSLSCLGGHVRHQLAARWREAHSERPRAIPRPRLGSILLQKACVTREQLDAAVLAQQRSRTGRIGEWLMHLGSVEEHEITWALSMQYGLPVMNLRGFEQAGDAARLMPGQVAKAASLVPVGYDEGSRALRVATAAPVSFATHRGIERMLRKKLLLYLGDESAVRLLLGRWYGHAEAGAGQEPDFHTLAELQAIGAEIVESAAAERARDVAIELIESLLWARIEYLDRAEHRFFRCGARECSVESAAAPARVLRSGSAIPAHRGWAINATGVQGN